MWEGDTVAVIAGGPSASEEGAWRLREAEIEIVVVNNAFQLAPWASILYAADEAWWNHTPGALKFEGTKASCTKVAGVNWIGRAGKVGYSDKADELHTFGNSGAQAIQIAAKAGAARILLLGFDMAGGHWHPEHAAPLRTTHGDDYALWRQEMPALAAALADRGIDVVNCSPGSALDCWPKTTLEDALAARANRAL